MYEILPSFVLGFHGCDHAIAEKVFAGKIALHASRNDYDWLGNGIYFWENNPQRALEYAQLLQKLPHRSPRKIKQPAVVGAVINLGFCLNLLDAQFIAMMKESYRNLHALHEQFGTPLPENKALHGSQDLLLRRLDCAVIEMLHSIRKEQRLTPFDSSRGVFVEGQPIYPRAGIHEANHIQICVRNPHCILGYFRVMK